MATIFCFSATGNSLYVAKRIAGKIGAEVVSMGKPLDCCTDDVIGFIFPVYFWGLPKIVERFVSALQIQNKDAYIFTIVTYGGVAYGVTGVLNRLLQRKGVSLQYDGKIKCVENYTPIYQINDTGKLHQKVDSATDIAAQEIARKMRKKPEPCTVANAFIYRLFPARKGDCDKNFSVLSCCMGCGTCKEICPVSNIALKNEEPGFLHHCEHCLACIHACPVGAIQWKEATKNKGRYRNPHIGLKELTEFCGTNR